MPTTRSWALLPWILWLVLVWVQLELLNLQTWVESWRRTAIRRCCPLFIWSVWRISYTVSSAIFKTINGKSQISWFFVSVASVNKQSDYLLLLDSGALLSFLKQLVYVTSFWGPLAPLFRLFDCFPSLMAGVSSVLFTALHSESLELLLYCCRELISVLYFRHFKISCFRLVISYQIPKELYRITQHIFWVKYNLVAGAPPQIIASFE